ncbi:type I methionyl aminopeptidase [Tersicoccus phoenicis]|uniref:Methionine aminopeptidase n=1 Tax=Tersicoccus phoenicis TaxID=554083 RepID=A0A1R1L6Z6_9MICC|nr:type I methionyl aminopeptidase [Tersicoccus phoenicis]OMH23189.1 type I methionyl aminopeptidase [Tersicoccus phoenicis]
MAPFARPGIEYKTREQMTRMAEAGRVTSAALDAAVAAAGIGVSTGEIDAAAAAVIRAAGATSNFLGYHGYPATLCISVNQQVVHGIPGEHRLAGGDLVSIDGGAIVDGWHGDSARTLVVGAADPADVELSRVTEEALWAGVAAFATATRVGDIGAAIDDRVTDLAGERFGILEDYVGHGIGTAMHQPPDVLNYRARDRGAKVRPGMCLAIEPMLVAGGLETTVLEDGWTVVTVDGARAAHWEHSVARHEDGIWVLTASDGGAARLAAYGVTPVAP